VFAFGFDTCTERISSPINPNPNPKQNPNGLFGIAALMLDYNDNRAIDIRFIKSTESTDR